MYLYCIYIVIKISHPFQSSSLTCWFQILVAMYTFWLIICSSFIENYFKFSFILFLFQLSFYLNLSFIWSWENPLKSEYVDCVSEQKSRLTIVASHLFLKFLPIVLVSLDCSTWCGQLIQQHWIGPWNIIQTVVIVGRSNIRCGTRHTNNRYVVVFLNSTVLPEAITTIVIIMLL